MWDKSKHLKHQLGPAFVTENDHFLKVVSGQLKDDQDNQFEMKHLKLW